MRETARAKATRILTDGRLVVTCVRFGRITSTCRGEGHIWHQTWPAGQWRCTCPATSQDCSHLLALQRVVAVDLGDHT